MGRRVDVWAVEERIGLAAALHALVARSAAVRPDPPAAEDRCRPGELVELVVVDEIPAFDDGVGAGGIGRADRGGEHLDRERLLRAECGRERRAEPVQERRPRRGLLVANVGVGQMHEPCQLGARRSHRTKLDAVAQRLPWADLEAAVALRVDPGGSQRRAARVGLPGRSPAAPAREQREHDRARAPHSERSPSTIGARSNARAASSTAAAEIAANVPTTISVCPALGASERSA